MVFNFEKKGHYHERNVGVFITSIIIVIGIYIPIICYYLFKFYKIRNTPYLQNRYPTLTITAVLSIVAVLFFGTWCGFLYVNGLDHRYLLIVFFFILVAGSVFAHSIMLRIWLLYFTVRVNKATLNDKWQSIINPNKNVQGNPCPTDNPNAFYLQNRKSYGNYHFMKQKLRSGMFFDIIILAVFFAVLFVLYVADVKQQAIQILFTVFMGFGFLFMFLVPLLIIACVYRLIPDFYDEFGVQQELLFLSKTYIISMVCLLVMTAGFVIDQFVIINRENSNLLIFYFAIDWNVNAFIMFLAALAMVRRYPNKLAKMNINNETIASITISTMPTMSTVMSEYKNVPGTPSLTAAKQQRVSNKSIKMANVLSHEESFEVFIDHLGHEYCMESLLSMIEFTHYRDYILYNEKELNIKQERQFLYCELPANIVKSDIVYPEFYKANGKCGQGGKMMRTVHEALQEYMKGNDMGKMVKSERIKKYKKIAYEIYDKYVRMGAEFEINISYAVRMRHMSLMNDKHIWINGMEDVDETQLFSLFDDCYLEMVRLMQQSFGRFKRGEKFEKVATVLQQNIQ